MFKNKSKYVVGFAAWSNIYVIKMNRLKIEIQFESDNFYSNCYSRDFTVEKINIFT